MLIQTPKLRILSVGTYQAGAAAAFIVEGAGLPCLITAPASGNSSLGFFSVTKYRMTEKPLTLAQRKALFEASQTPKPEKSSAQPPKRTKSSISNRLALFESKKEEFPAKKPAKGVRQDAVGSKIALMRGKWDATESKAEEKPALMRGNVGGLALAFGQEDRRRAMQDDSDSSYETDSEDSD